MKSILLIFVYRSYFLSARSYPTAMTSFRGLPSMMATA